MSVPILPGRTVVEWPTEETPLVDGMADAAQVNCGLPLVLVTMALSEVFGSTDPDAPDHLHPQMVRMRLDFEAALSDVVRRYMAGEFTGY